MSITDKVKWGSKNVATWILFLVTVFVISYLAWMYFHSRSKTGDVCTRNNDCSSKLCYVEDGRHMRYCTERCSSDADCPRGWRCLQPPAMPKGMYLCIRR